MHLLINGKVICHQFLPALHQAAASPKYMEYLRIRFAWTYADTCMVSWVTLHLALQSFPCPDQHRIVLFIYDKLPLCTSKFHPHLCPHCVHRASTIQRNTGTSWNVTMPNARNSLRTWKPTSLQLLWNIAYILAYSRPFGWGLWLYEPTPCTLKLKQTSLQHFNQSSIRKLASAGTSCIMGTSPSPGKRLLTYSTRAYHSLVIK